MADVEGWIPKSDSDREPNGSIKGSISLAELEDEKSPGIAFIPLTNVDSTSVLTIGTTELGTRDGTITKGVIDYAYWNVALSQWNDFIDDAESVVVNGTTFYRIYYDCTDAEDEGFQLWLEADTAQGEFFHHAKK